MSITKIVEFEPAIHSSREQPPCCGPGFRRPGGVSRKYDDIHANPGMLPSQVGQRTPAPDLDVVAMGAEEQHFTQSITEGQLKHAFQSRIFTAGIGTTKRPPHSRMNASCLPISRCRFHGRIST